MNNITFEWTYSRVFAASAKYGEKCAARTLYMNISISSADDYSATRHLRLCRSEERKKECFSLLAE